jgi:hypothetical protein
MCARAACAYLCICMCVYVFICPCVYVVPKSLELLICARAACAYLCICMCVYVCIYVAFKSKRCSYISYVWHVRICVCIGRCAFVCMCLCSSKESYISCRSVYTYVCIYVHVHNKKDIYTRKK